MESREAWRKFFRGWPAGLAQRGVLVTSFGEQIPFASFSAAEELLLVDRPTPDVTGARKVVVGYDAVVAVKLTDVVKPAALAPWGFASPGG
jgi:hypothetical protein